MFTVQNFTLARGTLASLRALRDELAKSVEQSNAFARPSHVTYGFYNSCLKLTMKVLHGLKTDT